MSTKPSLVNKALKAAGLKVEMVRGNGYYWFSDETTAISSIYAQNLQGFSTEEIVDHVRNELAKMKKP